MGKKVVRKISWYSYIYYRVRITNYLTNEARSRISRFELIAATSELVGWDTKDKGRYKWSFVNGKPVITTRGGFLGLQKILFIVDGSADIRGKTLEAWFSTKSGAQNYEHNILSGRYTSE